MNIPSIYSKVLPTCVPIHAVYSDCPPYVCRAHGPHLHEVYSSNGLSVCVLCALIQEHGPQIVPKT